MKILQPTFNRALSLFSASSQPTPPQADTPPSQPQDRAEISQAKPNKDLEMLKRVAVGAGVGLAGAVAATFGGPAVGMAVGMGLGAVAGFCNAPKAPLANKLLGAVFGGAMGSVGGVLGSSPFGVVAAGFSTAIGAATGYWMDVAKEQLYQEKGIE